MAKCGYLFVAPESFDFSNALDRTRVSGFLKQHVSRLACDVLVLLAKCVDIEIELICCFGITMHYNAL